MRRAWEIPNRDVRYGGRKDRHAVTFQTVTIFEGPQEDYDSACFSLRYRGQSERAFTAKDIEANEFEIQLRGLAKLNLDTWLGSRSELLLVPNYFDEQRFGSVGYSGELVAQPWCLGNYERAIFLALAEENRHDSAQERQEKAILRDHWGDWQQCKDLLSRSNRRSVITFLVDHPQGFKRAAALISRDMRSLYVAALQSRLWNETVSRLLQSVGVAGDRLDSVAGQLFFPHDSQRCTELIDKELPLPSSRPTQWPSQARKILEAVCHEYGLTPHKLRFSHPRDVFFSRASRPLFLKPQQLQLAAGTDELASENSSQKEKLELKFRLLPGQYATMLLRGMRMQIDAIEEQGG